MLQGAEKGNPVKIGSGPAAVTPPFSFAMKRELFWQYDATVLNDWNGKAARGAGKPEDLPWLAAIILRWDRIWLIKK